MFIDLKPGQVVRVRSFTHIVEDGTTQLTFAHPDKKAVFVLIYLGDELKKVLEGDKQLDVYEVLKSMGWTPPPSDEKKDPTKKTKRKTAKRPTNKT